MNAMNGSKTEVPRDVRNSNVRNKVVSGELCLNITTLANPKVGLDQVSGGVSVLCWHAAPVASVICKSLAIRLIRSRSVKIFFLKIGVMPE